MYMYNNLKKFFIFYKIQTLLYNVIDENQNTIYKLHINLITLNYLNTKNPA